MTCKTQLLGLLLLAAGLSARADEPVATNVRATQQAYPSYLVDIWYDLADADGDSAYITVQISKDGGASWAVSTRHSTGHVGLNVAPGFNRHILWDAGADAPNLEEVDMKVRVNAWGSPAPGELVLVPNGQFDMGQTSIVTPVHTVTLTRPFLLGRMEVTNQQYRAVAQWAVDHGYATVTGNRLVAYGVVLLDMTSIDCEITFGAGLFGLRRAPGASVYGFDQADTYDPAQHPVKMVSWYGSACYCDWMSMMNGLPAYYNGNWNQTPSPNNPYTATGYRLPTEAEWEFAAQFDDERTYPWGDNTPTCTYANYYIFTGGSCGCWSSPVGTHPAGATTLGMQDMAGNIWEWCNDWYVAYTSSPVTDPPGPSTGSGRILRGGGWTINAAFLPNAIRTYAAPSFINHYGFRLCRTLP